MSSDPCSCAISSTTVAGTLTGGIQDIAALLPLLGTEQCEDHVSSALTRGYLYAAASPMSLFGSLGVARAGFKTFVASFSIPAWNIVGARTLSNMGFGPQGTNLSLIMIDPNDKDGRYLVESRLENLIEELHIDKSKIQGVQHKTAGWNVRMVFLSAALCMLSMVPYIFLNIKAGSSLPPHTRWTFPPLRAAGGFLTTITMQFMIQMRVTTLARRWIPEHCSDTTGFEESEKSTSDNMNDVEKNPRIIVTDSHSPLMWFLLILLLLGVLASIVGYVGCFSVVQSAKGSNGPLSWLCLEAGLSLLRMFLWGWNPSGHDAPPLQLILARDPYPPLPTCKLYGHDIETEKTLPLTRANRFLNLITSFTGIVEGFDHPDVTLYYTLTRSGISNAEHFLYITIFDHKERANTRVYTRRSGTEHFYATESSLLNIDPKQGLLDIKLGGEVHHQDDLITSDHDIRSKLNTHYQSIMDQMHFAMRQSQSRPTYTIENKWTMAMVHTTTTPHRRGDEIQALTTDAITLSIRDFQYIQQGRFEKAIHSLFSARREWITTYMHWGIREVRERVMSQASTGMASDIEAPTGGSKAEGKRRMLDDKMETREPPQQPVRSDREDIESQIIDRIRRMELLLVQEWQVWEGHLWERANEFIGRDDVLEKPRLTMEWKRGFRTRLEADIRAMEARFDTAKLEIKASHSDELTRKLQSAHDDIRKARQALAKTPTPSPPRTNWSRLEHLQTEYENIAQDVEAIIEWSQPTATQREQLQQQNEMMNRSTIELEQAVFWMSDTHGLTKYKLSRSRWMHLDVFRLTDPLDVNLAGALEAMNDVIFVIFHPIYSNFDHYRSVAEVIHHLPSETSVFLPSSRCLPAIQRDTPLFINDYNDSNSIKAFLCDNQFELERTRRTHVFIDTGAPHFYSHPERLGLWNGSKIAVSFFGPPSGHLVLKLTHSSDHAATILILKESHGSRTFEYPVPSSLTATNITLFPSPSNHPSFVLNTRNTVT